MEEVKKAKEIKGVGESVLENSPFNKVEKLKLGLVKYSRHGDFTISA